MPPSDRTVATTCPKRQTKTEARNIGNAIAEKWTPVRSLSVFEPSHRLTHSKLIADWIGDLPENKKTKFGSTLLALDLAHGRLAFPKSMTNAKI